MSIMRGLFLAAAVFTAGSTAVPQAPPPQDPPQGAVEQPMPFVINAAGRVSVNKVIPVVVGGSTLTFFPNSVTANVGDVLQFQFAARNHTVTQSAEDSPCQPLLDRVGNAVHSGFIPFEAQSNMVGTFNVPVKDTKPMFLYCAQASHCQGGMVMAVNPSSSEQLIAYANVAAGAKNNVPGKFISGGANGVLPLASAAFPAMPSPRPTSSSSSSSTSSRPTTSTSRRDDSPPASTPEPEPVPYYRRS